MNSKKVARYAGLEIIVKLAMVLEVEPAELLKLWGDGQPPRLRAYLRPRTAASH